MNQYGADKIRSKPGSLTLVKGGLLDESQKTYIQFEEFEYITKKALEGLNIQTIIRTPFTNQTGLTINWQTDLADGTNTYAQLFGNYVEASLFYNNEPHGYEGQSWTLDGSNNVDVVTFDWGSSQSGYVRFG